jgi:hypothetical protein
MLIWADEKTTRIACREQDNSDVSSKNQIKKKIHVFYWAGPRNVLLWVWGDDRQGVVFLHAVVAQLVVA